jgi:hypothetical protein
MKVRNAPQRRREQVHALRRTLETAALLALARRIGLRHGGKLLALATAALLDQEPKRAPGATRRPWSSGRVTSQGS